MGVIFQGAYRSITRIGGKTRLVTVPSPADNTTPQVDWWYDHLAKQAKELANVGFTALLLPPVCKTSAGASPFADGYGVYDDYDIGSKNQFDTIPTRFGSREQLQRLCAIMYANDIDVYADMVPHQRSGGHKGIYNYIGPVAGSTGRFPKHPSCFYGPASAGRVPRDPIAGPVIDDYSFGDELCTVTSLPEGYVLNGLISAGDWLTSCLDLQGYRIDDTKGQVSTSVLKWVNSKSMAGKIAIGEYDDGNAANLNWWVWKSGMNGRAHVFDFALHYVLQAMCNNPSRFDMTTLDHAGYAGWSPATAVTFVENPDTDTDGFASIVLNKVLAYAYMLTTEGYPTVYYRDYSTDKNCYGLKKWIDNLVWIHENLASGETVYRYKDFQFVVFERTAYPNLLVGINNDSAANWKSATIQTGFGPNVPLHDYTGHAGDVWTDGTGKTTIAIPPNRNGLGYVCYSRYGQEKTREIRPRYTTQIFYGDFDLDLGPATTDLAPVGRIWVQEGTPITGEGSAGLIFDIRDESGTVISTNDTNTLAKQTGWHTINLRSTDMSRPYQLKVIYLAVQTLN